MRSPVLALALLVLFTLLAQPAAGLAGLIPVPPNTLVPTDPDGDGKYEDLNANSRKDFADVVLFFNQMSWIAANEPIAAFDFNGNSRIDFADVVSLFNGLSSTPTATPTPTVTQGTIISQTVAPSEQAQFLTGGGINLTIPGGALNETSLVRIATVPNPPSAPGGTGNLTVYDITIGTQTRFNPSLVIEIPYNPSMVPAGAAASEVIQGIRWDEETGAWRDIPTAVDETRHLVVLETGHLCVGGFTIQLQPAPNAPVTSEHFVVHFDPADDAAIAAYYTGEFASAHQMASAISGELENAYHTYHDLYQFRPPVPSRFHLDGRIHVYIGNYQSSEWGWFSKEITVAREPFLGAIGTPAEKRSGLMREMDHELFHAVENAYYDADSMMKPDTKWWMEGCAEYASTYIMNRESDFPLNAEFFTRSLLTVNGNHEYQVSHFINSLEKKGLYFVEIWNYTAASGHTYQDLDNLLKTKGTSLSQFYHQDFFIDEMWMPGLWTRSNGVWTLNSTWPVSAGILDGGVTTMSLGTHHLAHTFILPSVGGTRVWAIDIDESDADEEDCPRHNVIIDLPGDLPPGVQATVYQPGNGYPGWSSYFGNGTGYESAVFPQLDGAMDSGMIYIIITNTGHFDRELTLTVDDIIFTATPNNLTVEWGKPYTVGLVADNIPDGVKNVRFTWALKNHLGTSQDVPVVTGRAETTFGLNYQDSEDDSYVHASVGISSYGTRMKIPIHVL